MRRLFFFWIFWLPVYVLLLLVAGQLKNVDGINTDEAESMFILMILEKIKETRLKFSPGSVTVL